jgi:hypothetical protein
MAQAFGSCAGERLRNWNLKYLSDVALITKSRCIHARRVPPARQKKSKLRAVFLTWIADELPLDLAHPS